MVGRLGKALRIVSRVPIATVIVLVMVAIVISKLTGGTVPRILAPFTGWPSLVVLVGVVVVLGAWEPVRNLFRPVKARRPDDPRNVFNALRQVERYVWQRTQGARADRVRIQLALDQRPDAVKPPPNPVQRADDQGPSRPPGTGC